MRTPRLAAFAAIVSAGAAHAQSPAPTADARAPIDIVNQKANDADVFKFDFGVPSSPVLTLLDVDKDKVTQSNSLKPFVLALPDLLSSKESGQAAALDIAPAYFLLRKGERTYGLYQKDPLRQLLFRTRLAVGLYKGVNDKDAAKQKASRLAVGISTSLLPSSDPVVARAPGGAEPAFASCVRDASEEIASEALKLAIPGNEEEARLAAEQLKLSKRIDVLKRAVAAAASADDKAELGVQVAAGEADYRANDTRLQVIRDERQKLDRASFAKSEAAKLLPVCVEVAALAARLGTDLDLGIGSVWSGQPGKLKDFKDSAQVMWASLRFAINPPRPQSGSFADLKRWSDDLDQWFMAGASGRIGLSEQVGTGDSARPQISANTYTVWAGLERYSKTNRVAVQIGRQWIDPRLANDDAFKGGRLRYLIAAEQQLADTGAWLGITYGKAEGTGRLKSDKVVRLSISFAPPEPRDIFQQ